MLLGDTMENDGIYKTIGKNIKKYRKLKSITQEQLAQMANLSYGYIKNLEAPNVNATISIESLNLIAKCLDTTIIKLLDDA
jgi:transcriptional regulator with XRE-family HTH domain